MFELHGKMMSKGWADNSNRSPCSQDYRVRFRKSESGDTETNSLDVAFRLVRIKPPVAINATVSGNNATNSAYNYPGPRK